MVRLLARVMGIVLALWFGCPEAGAGDDPADPEESKPESRERNREGEDLEALRAVVAQNPSDVEARRRLAIALHRARRLEEALEQFAKAAEIQPSVRSLLDLALSYSSVSRLPEAEATYRRLLALSPNNATALHNMADIAFMRGEVELSVELYGKAIAAKPGYLRAYFHLAQALHQAGRYREAYKTYENVLELEPTTAWELKAYDDALYRMASLDIIMGEYTRAEKMLAVLLKVNPDHPSAHYAHGQVLLQLGRQEEAQREFETHMRILAALEQSGPVATGEDPSSEYGVDRNE